MAFKKGAIPYFVSKPYKYKPLTAKQQLKLLTALVFLEGYWQRLLADEAVKNTKIARKRFAERNGWRLV